MLINVWIGCNINSSPHSIEACRRRGIEPSELYFLNYESFLKLKAENSSLPREIIEERYNHYEKYRLQKLKKCIEERTILLNEEHRKQEFLNNHFKV